MNSEDAPENFDPDSDYNKGYRVGWAAATNQTVPKLHSGIQIIGPTFIVDQNGVGWWINPDSRRCEKV